MKDKIIDLLHEKFGVCGHCDKRNCTGRKTWTVLPNTLPTGSVLEIINSAESDIGRAAVNSILDEALNKGG